MIRFDLTRRQAETLWALRECERTERAYAYIEVSKEEWCELASAGLVERDTGYLSPTGECALDSHLASGRWEPCLLRVLRKCAAAAAELDAGAPDDERPAPVALTVSDLRCAAALYELMRT